MTRIRGLDGLRAAAISTVIANHIVQSILIDEKPSTTIYILSNGGLGVFIFFIISGFIITNIIINEYENASKFNFCLFYARRSIRIIPPLYFYLIFVVLTSDFTGINIDNLSLISSMFFVQNMSAHSDSWAVEHTWTLSIEEQFYLIWPVVLVSAMKYGGRNAAIMSALILIFISPIFRISFYIFDHDGFFGKHVETLLPCRMDALMFGCLTALSINNDIFERFYRRIERFVWFFPIQVIVISGALTSFAGRYYTLSVGQMIDGVCVSIFMLWVIRNPDSSISKVLNYRPIVHIGVISYSLYIWQTYFLHHKNMTVFGEIPLNLIMIFLAAELSYWLVERNAQRFRDRIVSSLRQET